MQFHAAHLVLVGMLTMASTSLADTTPAASNLGGGLAILTNNQLDSAPNNGFGAILLSQPASYSDVLSSCMVLAESLWNPDTQSFEPALNSSLAYQVYQGLAAPTQLYWVSQASAAGTNAPCRALTVNGTIVSGVDCQMALPALCTQSAPLSSSDTNNNSRSWQVQHTVNGAELTGYRDYHVFKFRGLRYAAPPARFSYAAPTVVSTADGKGNRWNATVAGADCSQPIGEVRSGSSEDCLFANVWTPFLPRSSDTAGGALPPRAQLKPVMVYYYGGGLRSGSSKNSNTDGTNLASRGDVVVVAVNYRVGSLGFLAFDDGVHNGNYAVSDMIAALQWVQKYIMFFGGDPERVTIFGESSGAQSVHLVMGSPKAKGLFRNAIMQSGPDGWFRDGKPSWQQYGSVAKSYADNTKKVLNETGCLAGSAADQIACLGKFSGFDLVNLTTNVNNIVMDGTYLVDKELVVNQSSASYATNVSIMTGFNRDETAIFNDQPANGSTFAQYFNNTVGSGMGLSPDNIADLLKNVPPASSSSANPPALTIPASGSSPEQIFNTSTHILTDALFGCFSLAKAYSGARSGAFRSVHAFMFNRTYNSAGYTKPWCNAPANGPGPQVDEYYKCHGGEQTTVFGTQRRGGQADRDGLDGPFMRLVVDYWAAFARSGGDPNPDPAWLTVRGYWDTLAETAQTGRWEAVAGESPTMRLLQWHGRQVPFVEQGACGQLGIPMTVLEVQRTRGRRAVAVRSQIGTGPLM